MKDISTTISSYEQALEHHTALSDYYALVRLLLQIPASDVVESVKEGLLADDYRVIAREAGLDSASIAEVLDQLTQVQQELTKAEHSVSFVRREYTRLFTHPQKPQIPLYEGVFLDLELERAGKASTQARLFVNPAAVDAEKLYRAGGLVCNSKDERIPADCITTELAFLEHLHKHVAAAALTDDQSAMTQTFSLIIDFHEHHVSKWIPRFFERCEEESGIEYYRAVGRMGRALTSVPFSRLSY